MFKRDLEETIKRLATKFPILSITGSLKEYKKNKSQILVMSSLLSSKII